MGVGIVTNTAALQAQSKLRKASQDTQASISRMTGNKIDKASTDVAALAIGTSLQTSVVTLKAALTNAGQASSLLGVADGGLQNIADILQRQKSLATQAVSGTLSDSARSYLNLEFGNLKSEIDRISTQTEFNGIKLLDGDLFSPSRIESKSTSNSISASAKLTFDGAIATTDAGDSISINGVQVFIRTSAQMANGIAELNLNVTDNTTVYEQAQALYDIINNVRNYQGTDYRVIEAKQKFSELEFQPVIDSSNSAAYLQISSKVSGDYGNTIKVGAIGLASGRLGLDGTDISDLVTNLTTITRGTQGTDGDLSGGIGDSITASGSLKIDTALDSNNDDDTLTIGDLTLTFKDGSLSSGDAALLEIDISTYTTASTQMQNIYDQLKQIQTYTGTDTSVLAAQDAIKNMEFTYSGDSNMKIASTLLDKSNGQYYNNIQIGASDLTNGSGAGILKLDGLDINATTVDLSNAIRGTYITSSTLDDGLKYGFKASGTLNIGTALTSNDAGSNLTINGSAIVLATSVTDELDLDVSTYTTAAGQAAQILDIFNTVKSYTGTDSTILAAKEAWADINMSVSGSSIKVESNIAGSEGNNIQIKIAAALTDGAIDLNGEALSTTSIDLSTEVRGTYVSSTSHYKAEGKIGDNLLKDIDQYSNKNSGVDVTKVSNNKDFIGTIKGFEATKNELNNNVDISIKVGNYTYEANSVNTNPALNQEISFTSRESGGGSFTLRMNSDKGMDVTNQADADAFSSRLDKALSKVNIYQTRTISNFESSGSIITKSDVTAGDFSGASFEIKLDNFTNVAIEDININCPVSGATNGLIKIKINGETYSSDNNIGSSIAANSSVLFTNESNPAKFLRFNNGSTDINFGTAEEAFAVQEAFKDALGVDEGGTTLQFQVGTSVDNTIEVSVQSATTQSIYLDDTATYIDISIDNLENARTAGQVLDNAIESITALRAEIGALQSRFDYASSNLETSIFNQDGARSSFLDTDVAEESTKLASSQIRMQAAVAVLAQANQLPQQLMQLIGG